MKSLEKFSPTWLMIKRHTTTGLMYFCKTVKMNPYKYNGSGKRWTNHLQVHGKHVDTIWCEKFNDLESLQEFALFFSEFNNIVVSDEWANIIPEDGVTGWPPGAKHTPESIEKCRINANGFKKGCIPHNLGKNSDEHYAKQIEGMKKFRVTEPDKYQKTLDNLKCTEKREINRKKAIKEKLSGEGNHNYDSTVYVFKHKLTLEEISMTRSDFYKQYNLAPQNVYKMVKGDRKSVNGWQLITI